MKIILMTILITTLNAQYVEKWRVDQNQYETGIISFDINNDEISDLTKYLWNNITVYDGNNNYSVLWTVTDDDYDVLTLWNIYDRESILNDLAIFISSNYFDSTTTAIMAYEVLGGNYIWKTTELQGTYSYVEVADVDNDLTLEVIVGLNTFKESDSTYTGKVYIIDSNTGNIEWISDPFDGYFVGPYVSDIDNDDNIEIVLNVYDTNNESYYLSVWSFDDGTNSFVDLDNFNMMKLLPSYPNPFNGNTIIPFILNENSNVVIDIVNLNGQRIKRLVNKTYPTGKFQARWNGKNDFNQIVSSGVYFVRMSINGSTNSRPIVFSK